MSTKRKDSKGRILRDGESQLPNGRYKFQFGTADNRKAVYSWRLVPTDKLPAGKRDGLSLRELEEQIAKDLRDGIDPATAAKLTLNDVFELYLTTKPKLKASTKNTYLLQYDRHVRESIGKLTMSKIKYSTVKQFFNSLIDDHELSPATLEQYYTILHPVFTLAVRDGLLRLNPCDGVLQELRNTHDWTKEKRHALTEDQQELLVDFLATSDLYRHWAPLVTVLLGTGMRIGECLGLRWEDVDFKSGQISVNHTLTYREQANGRYEAHISTPKTAAGVRTIPMLAEVRKALLTERAAQLREGRSFTGEIDGFKGFCFTGSTGNVHTLQAINSMLARVRRACNEQEALFAKKAKREPVVIPHFTAHNLRHSFCSRLCAHETDLKMIQEVMGHSSIKVTMDVYNEVSAKRKSASFANLEGKMKIG